MPSFDIVSEVDQHELDNAIDQTNREISARFDFKDANALIEKQEKDLLFSAESEFQIEQMVEMFHKKAAKRAIDIQCFENGKMEVQNRRTKLIIKVKQGIESDLAKKIVKLIKDSKIKVQAAIQGEQVRVTGKKRDDLQEAIALIRANDLGLPLQFNNFRD